MTGSPSFGIGVALFAAAGVHLCWTATSHPRRAAFGRRPRQGVVRTWLVQAGLGEVAGAELIGVLAALVLVAGMVAFVIFGGALPALVAGALAAASLPASYRRRRADRLALAQESWPRLIEEIRILTGSLGRSIPQALFDVGRRGPADLQPAFAAAHREWLLTTNFGGSLQVLKDQLADPTADAACETLLVAHELGGADLDRRLVALADDRVQDNQGRKDARAKQAGVRFARRFVLAVPVGMAFAGMSVGEGRSAYGTSLGQTLVVAGIVTTAGCWLWAGRIMRLPAEQRVFVA